MNSDLKVICQLTMAVETVSSYFCLTVTSSLTAFGSEKRFQSSVTIGELKGKLELITGATASLMQLQLLDSDGKLICEMDKDSATLGSYPVENGYKIHVIDHDPSREKGEFEDVSKVEKYELSEEAYAQRTVCKNGGEGLAYVNDVNVYLGRQRVGWVTNQKNAFHVRVLPNRHKQQVAFKRRMKLGQFAEKAGVDTGAEEKERQEAEAIPIGSRCEVTLPAITPRRGTVMFVGKTHFKTGYWVGVKYDEPLGKNNGSVDGKKYFECPPKYGAFVRPKNVKVGDYPEDTYSDDEM